MYLAQYSDNRLIALAQVSDECEIEKDWNKISKEQYEMLYAEILEKSKLVDEIYNGSSSIDNVPPQWQAEIIERVEARRKYDELLTSPDRDISGEEAQKIMIEGV